MQNKTASAKPVPEHWHKNSWEEKAQENPLHAIMTSPEMADAGTESFSPEHLEKFFAKGQFLFDEHIAPLLETIPDTKESAVVVDYGCGAGRILKAVHNAGYYGIGVDISPTMLRHCAAITPEAKETHLLREDGSIPIEDGRASIVYSYAVVQHIESLQKYMFALREMCRILKPGGILAVQVNCEDFPHGNLQEPLKTENFETYSLHYEPGKEKPRRHDQTTWSGVYIGHRHLVDALEQWGMQLERHYYHTPNKLRNMWYVARKRA